MPTIPKDFIEQVRGATNIVDVISRYLPLKASGKNFKGLCPFHNEKTPSFHVNTERQIFHCFGCDVGGDAFKFLMLYEKHSFVEAVRELANRAGLSLPRSSHGEKWSDDRARLIEIHEQAARFFRERLASPAGKQAVAYLRGRGLSDDAIRATGFGFAPDQWTSLCDYLRRVGTKPEEMVKAGVAVTRRSGQGVYDRFRNRVIIPIHNESSKVVAFGGRLLGDGEPKYLNSPETPIYNKSQILYGFDVAKKAIRNDGFAILMEGYLDCIQAYQAEVHPAVACCGTALTEAHCRLLKRYTDRILLNFDRDAAGNRATHRSIDLLLQEGFDVRVVLLPEGEDPDSFIRSAGAQAYRERLDAAPSFVHFLIEQARKRYDVSTPRGKTGFLDEVLPHIAKIPNRVERTAHVSLLAERAGISDAMVVDELRRQVADHGTSVEVKRPVHHEVKPAERDLIRWILQSPDAIGLLEEIESQDLEGLATAPILETMQKLAREGQLTVDRLLESMNEDADRKRLTRIVTEPVPLGPRQSPRDCLNRLREERLSRRLSHLKNELREKLAKGADDDNLTAEIQELARRIDSLRRIETIA